MQKRGREGKEDVYARGGGDEMVNIAGRSCRTLQELES